MTMVDSFLFCNTAIFDCHMVIRNLVSFRVLNNDLDRQIGLTVEALRSY